MSVQDEYVNPWPLWQKVLFRFFFIYLLLHVFSWPFFQGIPLLGLIGGMQRFLSETLVHAFNEYILHFREELVPPNGSGDTSFGWAQILCYLFIAFTGSIIWSIIDRKRKSYYRASYYLNTSLRFYIAFISFTYGIIKVFALQMPFPSLSDMATPMGDFPPMRFSWHFIGYSPVYQIFSGAMEVLAGLLLIYRRTVTLGIFVALGVFVNVMMINLSYDVPVKIFSTHLVIMCLYLLMTDIKRISNFFIFNRPAVQNRQYHFAPSKKSRKIFRLVLKVLFIGQTIYLFTGTYQYYQNTYVQNEKQVSPVPHGMYETDVFVKNGDTLPILAKDSLAWKDFIFEKSRSYVTVNSADTLLSKRYRRGMFYYKADTLQKTMDCYKYSMDDSIHLFTLKYRLLNDENIELHTKINNDSLYFKLRKNNHKFRMANREFNWITDYIR